MKIIDMLYEDKYVALPELPLLQEHEIWWEAILIGVMNVSRLDKFAMLIDLRSAMYLGDEANTAIILFDRVYRVYNSNNLAVLDNLTIEKQENHYALKVVNTDGFLEVNAKKINVYLGNVSGIGDVSQSFDERELYWKTTQNFNSTIELTHLNRFK